MSRVAYPEQRDACTAARMTAPHPFFVEEHDTRSEAGAREPGLISTASGTFAALGRFAYIAPLGAAGQAPLTIARGHAGDTKYGGQPRDRGFGCCRSTEALFGSNGRAEVPEQAAVAA
jgi:hypothetical protein